MQGSLEVGTIAGIEIRLDYTWLLAMLLIAWSLSSGYFSMAGEAPRCGVGVRIFAALRAPYVREACRRAACGEAIHAIMKWIHGSSDALREAVERLDRVRVSQTKIPGAQTNTR